jgi:membrane-associated phospholipid phosphatase
MKADPKPMLPHELLFGLFLAITWARLVLAVGVFSDPAMFYLTIITLNVAVIWHCRRKETPFRWRLRLLFYPVAMNLVYPHLKVVVPKLQATNFDSLLQHLDTLIVGGNLSLRLQPFTHPVLTELLSFCYLLFFPYLLVSIISYFTGDLELLKKFIIGLFAIYGIGFLGYSILPAKGPCIAMAGQFNVPLTGWWITRWNAAVVAQGSNGVDVFPSLHCAVSAFLLFFDRRHGPWRFRLLLIPCVGLWFSTIYLRYHYFIDVACGFTLAAFALWLANRFPRKTMNQHVPRPVPAVPVPNSNSKSL